MHPAASVIFFTSVSGAGYGLLALLGAFAAAEGLPSDRWFAIAAMGLSLALITAGLFSSLLHLGHPERAWRALSQWRTSWLSREGVAAALSYGPALAFGFGWIVHGRTDGWVATAALAAAALAIATVACTGMIYASLKPIRQWRNVWVVPNYLALAAMTGALWLHVLLRLWGGPSLMAGLVALAAIPIAAWLKERYWGSIDADATLATAGSATALGGMGTVRLLEAPHTEENYLLKEMGFRIARKHALRLRRLVLACAFAAPLALTLLALVAGGQGLGTWIAVAAAALAAVSAMFGTIVERWLFFAEATHTVTLYYGTERV